MALETVDYGVVRVGPLIAEVDLGSVFGQPAPPNDSVPQDFYWVVTAMTSQVKKGPGRPAITGNVPLFVYDQDPQAVAGVIPISKTIDGVLDVNDTCRLIVQGGNSVFFQWVEVPLGASCYARVQYELVAPTGAAAQRPVMH